MTSDLYHLRYTTLDIQINGFGMFVWKWYVAKWLCDCKRLPRGAIELKTKRLLQCAFFLGMMSLPLSADITFSNGGVSCSTAQGTAGLCTPYAAQGAQTISFDGLAPSTVLSQTFG